MRMGNDRIRGIGCGAHYGGGFSRWHTRAVSWAVSAAFTFLLKIEGYGAGSRLFSSFSPCRYLSPLCHTFPPFPFVTPSRLSSVHGPPCSLAFVILLSSSSSFYLCLSLSRTHTEQAVLLFSCGRAQWHVSHGERRLRSRHPRGCTCSLAVHAPKQEKSESASKEQRRL